MTADAAPEPLALDEAAACAGCTPAYLAECIASGQLEAQADGRVDAHRLATWRRDGLQPQQRALRAVVDAIDTMERRSLKPSDGGEAVAAEAVAEVAGTSAASNEPPTSAAPAA